MKVIVASGKISYGALFSVQSHRLVLAVTNTYTRMLFNPVTSHVPSLLGTQPFVMRFVWQHHWG
jgi:hypothetical protein